MNEIKGVFPPAVTIFNQSGEIDYPANYKLTDFLINAGVDGIAYLGTSGEFSSLTLEEKKEFLKRMKEYVNGRVKVLAGVGHTSIKEVLSLMKFYEDLGINGVLFINPYYTPYPDHMIIDFYNKVASSTSLSIVLYNFPALTGYSFNLPVLTTLVEKNKNIVGLKDTIDSLSHLRELNKIKEVRADFSLFCAFENQFLPALTLGIDSFISATANFAPELTIGIMKAYNNNDLKAASKHYLLLMDAMDIYSLGTPILIPCKEAVYQKLSIRGVERSPALGLSEDKKKEVGEILKKITI